MHASGDISWFSKVKLQICTRSGQYITVRITNLGKTWVAENVENLVSSYVRKWLDLPISVTLSSLALPKAKYGIDLILPSTNYSECQTVTRNTLKSSPNSEINIL